MLQQVCEVLVRDYDGQIPDTREELLSISGVGQYIADAFLCFARREPLLVLDTNTARVAKEVFSIEPADDLRLDNNIRPAIEPYVPESSPREFNWGLIDLGTELRDGNSRVLSEYFSFRD